MNLINLNVNAETNVNWLDDGEPISAAVLNRPIIEVAGFVNTLSTEVDALRNNAADESFINALLFGGE